MLIALKHHVLEKVGEAAALRGIVLRADVIPDLDRDRGAGMIFHRIDLEAVRQLFVPEVERGNSNAGLRRRRRLGAPRNRSGD